MISYICGFLILVIYLYKYYTNPKRQIDKMFPGPITIPFLGNTLLLIRSPKAMYQLYLNISKRYNYKTFRFWFLNKPHIGVPDYKVAKMILSDPSFLDKPDEYKLFDPWLGDEFIFTGPEELWKRGRKAALPAFHFNIIKQYFGAFHQNAKILCEILKKHDGKNAFDIFEPIRLYALDNVCDTVCGFNMQAQNNTDLTYEKAFQSLKKLIYCRGLLLWLRSDTIFNMSSFGSLQKKNLAIIHGFSNKIVQERRNKISQKDGKDSDPTEKKDFLDTLIENGQTMGFNDAEIRQMVDGLIFAGYDTVSTALGFIVYTLAEHQEVQEKVYQEVERIFQNSERCPTFDDLQEMTYTEQVIKECLRLSFVNPLIGRRSKKDVFINGKQYIPKNVDVWILIGAIHRDPEIYPKPDEFDPERFSPEAMKNRDPYTFLPFSAGPKMCMGYKFAMFEMKITLCVLLRKFKLRLSDNPKDKPDMRLNFVAYSANGIRIKIESRNIE